MPTEDKENRPKGGERQEFKPSLAFLLAYCGDHVSINKYIVRSKA